MLPLTQCSSAGDANFRLAIALEEEAVRLGVSLHGTWASGAQGRTTVDEPELQSRVIAARAEHRGAILNIVQTIGIVGSLALTLILAAWNHTTQLSGISFLRSCRLSRLLALRRSRAQLQVHACDLGTRAPLQKSYTHRIAVVI
jgi:hypothetical protein